ncbi:unnamed protein product, partial [Rotaria magnacalcarata]
KEKGSGQKEQRPPATTTAAAVSELAQNVEENLVIENGASATLKGADGKSESTINQNDEA